MDRDQFFEKWQEFQLGDLPTEQPHPLTRGLAETLSHNPLKAAEQIKQVDLQALRAFEKHLPKLQDLKTAIDQTLFSGGRIFLCGCGATGRLSLLLESLWREKFPGDQVVAFMAGGDTALVHSLEGFEDFPDFGRRHLNQLGFASNDLLIGITEGGETPFVIGATQAAAGISKRKPFFVYCNPDSVLREKVVRSQQVIDDPRIHKICLEVGPMALSGSTRMQASTVLQLAVGLCLFHPSEDHGNQLKALINQLESFKPETLVLLIKKEAQIYLQNEFVMYVPRQMAITVFTDTTERSPTFSLPSFEREHSTTKPSLCYILIPSSNSPESAWQQLLGRPPRPLDWKEVDRQTTDEYLRDFDFSKHALEHREPRLNGGRQYLFEINQRGEQLELSLGGVEAFIEFPFKTSLLQHSFLKILLNTHSTLTMGLLGRYRSNVMTWVRPTNGKLIDRATRYIHQLLKEKNIEISYLEIARTIFDLKPKIQSDDSLVMEVVHFLTQPENQGERHP